MPVIGLALALELDGRALDLSPLIRNYYVTDARLFSFHIPHGVSYQTALPMTDALTLVTVLVMQSTELLTVRLNAQTSGGFALNAGGLFILAGTHLTGSPLVSLFNDSGRDAQIRGVVGGRA